ncbi:MAG TPA: aminotransferase class III-fold pyridoxal phosphate-dependent enzyme [Phnomibacter sp.]|nr:aminotransferase class III-fold pyridoxal phosphate-dependent enzyme [Phnomibacter sp.]
MNQRQLFLQHIAQTSPAPMGLEIVKAEGIYMWDAAGKPYVDLISGFSVMNIGHGNAAVKAAVKKQVDDYMHLMVYGEMIETPQVQYAKKLTGFLPENLDCVYFTNSGAEATEGAMKLAKRVTGRTGIVAFNNAYHGSTQGALSIMGDEYWRNAYRPLLPDVHHVSFNQQEAIEAITSQTACVVVEVVQAEAGAQAAKTQWLQALRNKCTEVGALLIFDEIQTGFGRTGTLWAFQQYEVVPDILLLGKALGGGLPLGAFISSHQHMQQLTSNPVLGHISTFAGHPVCCAAGLAAFDELLQMSSFSTHQIGWNAIGEKEQLFRTGLVHPAIKAIHGKGLLLAVEFESAAICQNICHACVKEGFITDWFLFAPHCLRIAPPLNISEEEINQTITGILGVISQVSM